MRNSCLVDVIEYDSFNTAIHRCCLFFLIILRFVPRERQLVDQPGTWVGYLNAILAIGRREFVGIWTNHQNFGWVARGLPVWGVLKLRIDRPWYRTQLIIRTRVTRAPPITWIRLDFSWPDFFRHLLSAVSNPRLFEPFVYVWSSN